MSFVYFIKPVGMDGPIKIGCTTMLDKRVMELANWSPIPLELIGIVPGNLSQESYLHRCFADDHSHKEWFRATPRLVEVVRLILAAGSVDAISKDHQPEGGIRRLNPAQHSRRRKPESPLLMGLT